MQSVRRFRIPALLCALAVLVCTLVAHPYTNMGVCDDGPYIAMAQTLSGTGHLVYNGWPAAMLGWQLYLGAAFIKMFGFSLTIVRMSTLLVAMGLAFLLQRTLVRAGISERDATIGTLALVLSPLYLLLSVTYMSDTFGLFAVLVCLHSCLRALCASTHNRTILWICCAVACNALLGTCRQVAWLGILAFVPSTLWLLRSQRRVLLAGATANLVGVAAIFACLRWFARQPYIQPEHLIPSSPLPFGRVCLNMVHAYLYIPFLLLPVIALFLPKVWNNRRTILTATFITLTYVVLSLHRGYALILQPPMGDWVTMYGTVHETGINGEPAVLLNTWVRGIITIGSLGGLIGLVLSFVRTRHPLQGASSLVPSWRQLATLFGPFTILYTILLIPRAATVGLSDRYVLELAFPALFFLLRYYQHTYRSNLPRAAALLVGLVGLYGIITTHNTFALYRARTGIAAELRAKGVPDTSVDYGWEYNFSTELQHAVSLNDYRIITPPGFYIRRMPPLPLTPCVMYFADTTPHIDPIYAISFEPNSCYGATTFAPVHYSTWPYRAPGTLYVVRYTAGATP